MEKCVFCGWTRRTAYPSIRFFAIPREPGMKRIQWLYALGKKQNITTRDRVCSVHFRNGRPSSDPSHEDFAPHLYLNREPPPEVIEYLESLAEQRAPIRDKNQDKSRMLAETTKNTPRPSILKRKRPRGEGDGSEVTATTSIDEENVGGQVVIHDEGKRREVGLVPNPPPLLVDPDQRFPVPNVDEEQKSDVYTTMVRTMSGETKRMRLQLVQREVFEAMGVRQGTPVIIRRRILVQKKPEDGQAELVEQAS